MANNTDSRVDTSNDKKEKPKNEEPKGQESEPTGPDPELISTIEKGIGFGEDYKKPKK